MSTPDPQDSVTFDRDRSSAAAIADRMGFKPDDPERLQFVMDLQAAAGGHDCAGIHACMDRSTGKLGRNFVPRVCSITRRRLAAEAA